MESWDDLALWRNQLIEEKDLLTKLLAQIDEQINCLQVEQMELTSAMRKNECRSPLEQKPQTNETAEKKLDLTPAITKNDIQEEEDEDDEDF